VMSEANPKVLELARKIPGGPRAEISTGVDEFWVFPKHLVNRKGLNSVQVAVQTTPHDVVLYNHENAVCTGRFKGIILRNNGDMVGMHDAPTKPGDCSTGLFLTGDSTQLIGLQIATDNENNYILPITEVVLEWLRKDFNSPTQNQGNSQLAAPTSSSGHPQKKEGNRE